MNVLQSRYTQLMLHQRARGSVLHAIPLLHMLGGEVQLHSVGALEVSLSHLA